MNLENKIVLITGSSKGIGEQIAYAFSRQKAKVVITYNSDKQSAHNVEAECKKLGALDSLIVNLDITDDRSIQECIKSVEEKFGHIDILINNAGVIGWEKFEHETLEEIEKQLRTNLEGMIKMTSAAFVQIKEGIINVASRAGHLPYPGRATYCATKFGVVGFTKSLALEYPELKIFTVSPGAVKTEMWNFQSGIEPEVVSEYIVKAWLGEVPLKDGDLNLWEIIS